jgi:hypothetical protein
MKKITLAVVLLAASFIGAKAQSGHNQIGIGADVAIPTGDFGDAYKTGFGGSVKGLFGIGSAGQITLTTGYTSFKAKGSTSDIDVKASIIPILAGYRHNFNGFYVEPEIGYGIYGSKVSGMGSGYDGSSSDGAFTWAAGIGYAMAQGLDLGARYQSASKDGSTTSLIGFSVRWNFTLGGASASN